MALQIHSICSVFQKSYPQLQVLPPSKPNLRIHSQNPTTDAEPASPPPNNSTAPGLGFGSSSPSSSTNSSLPNVTSSSTLTNKKKPKGKRDRASIIRRSPVQKPAIVSQQEEAKAKDQHQGQIESAFILSWLGLGGIILAEGLLLSASGFLPDEWDKLFVKYLYPNFTPTVFLFVAGSVAYGVLKYLQNENLKDLK